MKWLLCITIFLSVPLAFAQKVEMKPADESQDLLNAWESMIQTHDEKNNAQQMAGSAIKDAAKKAQARNPEPEKALSNDTLQSPQRQTREFRGDFPAGQQGGAAGSAAAGAATVPAAGQPSRVPVAPSTGPK